MSDSKTELSASEQKKLSELQNAKFIKDHPRWHLNHPTAEGEVPAPGVFNDADLLRFLRARKWDLKGAADQLNAQLQWRKKNDVDYILDNPPAISKLFKKILPGHLGLFDKFGRPVIINCPGRANVGIIRKYISVECATKCHAWTQENIRKLAREQTVKLGRPVEKLLSIVDLTGLNMDHMGSLDVMKAMFSIDERYYPETLGATLVINAPSSFTTIWGLIKRFLDPAVVAKVQILGSGYLSKLEELFDDVKVLPVEIVPGGTEGMLPPVNVEEVTTYFDDLEAKECKKATLTRSQKVTEDIKVNAAEKAQMIEWWFKTSDTLKYSVSYFKDGADAKKPVTVKKLQEVEAQKNPIEGFVFVKPGQTGIIRLIIDNTRLVGSSRGVTYKLTTRDAKDYEVENRLGKQTPPAAAKTAE